MSPLLGEGFMVLTMLISVPSVVLGVGWLGTVWRGSIRLTTPMLFALGVVTVFGLGGFTGLFLADVLADVYLHDTFFVVGHFHLTMSAAVLLGAFAAIYFWFPKMFGRMMNEPLGKLHFALTLVTVIVTFGLQLVLGYAGMQRRLADPSAYAFLRPLMPLNRVVSQAAFVMGAAQLAVRGELLLQPVLGTEGARESVAGGHARLDGALAAAPPQLRRAAARVRGPARAGQSRRESRARGRLPAAERGTAAMSDAALAELDDPEGQARATVTVGMTVALAAIAMTFAALLLAYGSYARRRPPGRPPGEAPLPPLWGLRLAATATALAGSWAMRAAAPRARVRRRHRPGRRERWSPRRPAAWHSWACRSPPSGRSAPRGCTRARGWPPPSSMR